MYFGLNIFVPYLFHPSLCIDTIKQHDCYVYSYYNGFNSHCQSMSKLSIKF